MQDPDQEGRHTRASGIPGSAPQARGRAIARIITRSLATPEAVEDANYRALPERGARTIGRPDGGLRGG